MASTFGEMLVFTDLMEKESDPQARLALLAGKIEDSFATIFRQISMNRFEHALHTARREEGELTSERISELWLDTQRAMFGDSVRMTDDYGIWWSYVPHFLHTPGYVYAYAFGSCSSWRCSRSTASRRTGSPGAIWTCCARAARTGRRRSSRRWAWI